MSLYAEQSFRSNPQYISALSLLGVAQGYSDWLRDELPKHTANTAKQDQIISSVLRSIWDEQIKLKLPLESPAIVTDNKGAFVSVAVAGTVLASDNSNLSVLEAQQRATQLIKNPDLYDLGYSLHQMGDPSSFDGSGGTYNFAPSRVVLTPLPNGLRFGNVMPVSENYWSEANIKRKMEVVVLEPKLEIGSSLGEFSIDSFSKAEYVPLSHVEQPIEVYNAIEKWRNYKFQLDDVGNTSKEDPRLKELMKDLHKLAMISLNTRGGPFAAAVINKEGQLISIAVNRVVPGHDAIAHGEESALVQAIKKLQELRAKIQVTDLEGCTLVTTSMTCISCAEQAVLSGISAIYYDNLKDEIQDITELFTEGPIKG